MNELLSPTPIRELVREHAWRKSVITFGIPPIAALCSDMSFLLGTNPEIQELILEALKYIEELEAQPPGGASL